jgi:type II secretory pathway pseudopilin PulG
MRHPGTTLIELVVVLAVLAVLLGVAVPSSGQWRDGAAVRAARDELAAGLAQARVTAVASGGAALILDPLAGRFWTVTDSGPVGEPVSLEDRYGVLVDPGGADLVVFRYDGLGIGRLTSRTVHIRRGGAEAGLTVSAYGRTRRW